MEVYPEAIVGFRTWTMSESGLESLILPEAWPVHEPMRAECLITRAFDSAKHDSPMIGCKCGLYAFTEVPHTWRQWAENEEAFQRKLGQMLSQIERSARGGLTKLVPGAVYCWGRGNIGSNGLKTEFAYPKALGMSLEWPARKRAEIMEMADMYSVPIFPVEDLHRLA